MTEKSKSHETEAFPSSKKVQKPDLVKIKEEVSKAYRVSRNLAVNRILEGVLKELNKD